MYEVSKTFLTPVLLLIIIMFIYSIFEMGVFIMQYLKRKRNYSFYKNYLEKNKYVSLNGYPIMTHFKKNGFTSIEDLEILAFKKLQNTSLVTKVSPMLGLVATMIPMGPALKALSSGNIQGISENLIIAFAAVIFALVTASLTYWLTLIRKGWYAVEIKDILETSKEESKDK